MKKDKISRRDFLKVTLLGIGTGFLAACKRMVKPVATIFPTGTSTPTSTQTETPMPTETNTPRPTPTETETPTPTEIPCFQLLTPENKAVLEPVGKVVFSWEAMPKAAIYKLELILPSNQSVIFETSETSRTQYIEAISVGGEFHWQVSAFDAKGNLLCTAASFTFEKSEYVVPKPSGNGGGGDGGNGPKPPPPPGGENMN